MRGRTENGERKGKRGAEKECVYVFIERVCRILCALCITVSSDKVGERWTRVI